MCWHNDEERPLGIFKNGDLRSSNLGEGIVLVFQSWGWSFHHGFMFFPLYAFLRVCLASFQLHLLEFHPSICSYFHPSILPPISSIILLIVSPLAILTYPSHLPLYIFICHPYPSIHLTNLPVKWMKTILIGVYWFLYCILKRES